MRRKHYPELDGLRGIAVLMVMLLHFTLFSPHSAGETFAWAILNTGWVGVDLFFVLSGFLITGILYDSRDKPQYFRNFYARRTLRIFPLYYAYLFLLFIVLPLLVDGYAMEHATNDRRWWLWTYLGNILMGRGGWEAMPSHTTHLWSLAIEEQFYLIWPLLVYRIPKERLTTLCAAAFAGAIVTRIILAAQGAAAAGYVFTPARMDTLAAGAMIAVLLRQRGPEYVRALVKPLAAVGGALILGGSAWSVIRGADYPMEALELGTQQLAYPGIALLFAGVVAFAVTRHGESRGAFLTGARLRMLGKYSYALYLIHVPLRNVFGLVLLRTGGLPRLWGSEVPAQIVLTLVGVGLSLAAAWLSWHLFEKHFLVLKDRFFATHRAVPDAVGAPTAAVASRAPADPLARPVRTQGITR